MSENDPPRPLEPGGVGTGRPAKVSVSIRFRADLADELRRLAEAQHRSFNGTVNEACKRYVRQMRPRVQREGDSDAK